MFKDTVITAKQKKQELIIFSACLAAAFIFNIVAINMYDSPVIELITQLHIVFLIACFLYLLIGIFRILFWLIKRLILITRKAV